MQTTLETSRVTCCHVFITIRYQIPASPVQNEVTSAHFLLVQFRAPGYGTPLQNGRDFPSTNIWIFNDIQIYLNIATLSLQAMREILVAGDANRLVAELTFVAGLFSAHHLPRFF